MTKSHDSNEKYVYLYKLSREKLMELLLSAPIPAATPEDEIYVDAILYFVERAPDSSSVIWHPLKGYVRNRQSWRRLSIISFCCPGLTVTKVL